MYDSFKVVKVCTISVTNIKLLLLILWFTGTCKINQKNDQFGAGIPKEFSKEYLWLSQWCHTKMTDACSHYVYLLGPLYWACMYN